MASRRRKRSSSGGSGDRTSGRSGSTWRRAGTSWARGGAAQPEVGAQLLGVGRPGQGLQGLGEGRVGRHPLALEAVAPQDLAAVARGLLGQLLGQAGLADARLAGHHHQAAPAHGRLGPACPEALELGLPSHERQPARDEFGAPPSRSAPRRPTPAWERPSARACRDRRSRSRAGPSAGRRPRRCTGSGRPGPGRTAAGPPPRGGRSSRWPSRSASPALSPTRMARRSPCTGCRPSCWMAMAHRRASAAEAKATMSPSPSHLTSSPPWAPATSARRPWWARKMRCASSSPARARSSVEPTRSVKRMVTTPDASGMPQVWRM